MPLLKNKIEYIQKEEDKIRENYGVDIVVVNYSDPTPGPDYDPYYKIGLIRSKIEYPERVLIYWISETELRELPVGGLKVGDIIIKARPESKPYFEKALEQKNPIEFEGKLFVPHLITENVLRTHIKVYCTRVEDTGVKEGG